MAVPAGYKWVKEFDPQAQWDPQTRYLTALGRTYKPGEYYLEGGRAYIPSPVPEGYQWVRSYFAPDQVSYDQATRTIKLPGGLNIPQSSLLTVGGRTYAPASQLAQAYQTYAATYKPPEPTAEDVKRKSEALMQVYAPLMEAVKGRLALGLDKITQQAEAQRRLAEAAWANALTSLSEQESKELRSTAHTVAGRGLASSPLAEYQRRKVQEAFAKERTKLETDKAAQLANIATQASLAAYELAQQGQEQQAQWASQIAQYAYNALQSDAAEQKKAVQTLADYFAGLAEAEETRQLATWQRLVQEANLTGYYQGQPTYEREQWEWKKPWQEKLWQYELSRPYFAPTSGGRAPSPWEVSDRTLYVGNVASTAIKNFVEGSAKAISPQGAVDHDALDRLVRGQIALLGAQGLTPEEKASIEQTLWNYRNEMFPRPVQQPAATQQGGLRGLFQRLFSPQQTEQRRMPSTDELKNLLTLP